VATAVSALLGLGYTRILGAPDAFGLTAGASIGASIVAFELFVVQGRFGVPLRRLPLWLTSLVALVVWVVCIVISIRVIAPAVTGLQYYPQGVPVTIFSRDLVFSIVIGLLVNFGVRARSLFGGRVLINFLLGRYHRPLRENQVFLFVDVIDARGLAKRLGDLRAQSLIATFFFDIARVIVEHGGETHRYVGDELVVTWPLARGTVGARCVRCALAIESVVKERALHYRLKYGETPQIRMALHGGAVVVSEIGDNRREIVYFGDTINTTARLRSLAKQVGRRLLISADLLAQMRLPPGVHSEDMGEFNLSGKEASVRVYAVHDGDGGELAAAA
jgi:adenylate cyclase